MNLRSEFVMKALDGANAFEYGISAKTGYKWVDWFKQDRLTFLSDASRRPRGHGRQLSEDMVCETSGKETHTVLGAKKDSRSLREPPFSGSERKHV